MVSWTDSAKRDLRQIYDYIAINSPYYAQKETVSIVTKADMIGTFPQMGRMVPELMDTSIREIILNPYRVIYRISTDDSVEILSIIHVKRNFDDAFSIT